MSESPAEQPTRPPLRLFTFAVTCDSTGETASFKGQGDGIESAFKEGYANLTYGHLNPSTSGGPHANLPLKLHVVLPDGAHVSRKREEFESGVPFTGPRPAPNPEPKSPEEIARLTAAQVRDR